MSISLTVKIDAAAANASLRAITTAAKDKKGLHGSIANGVDIATRKHLRDDYLPRDHDGLTFWARTIKGVQSKATTDSATVTLTELGIALRYYGGNVTPGKSISSHTGKPTRALAVPTDKVPVKDGRRVRPKRAGILAFIFAARGRETVGYLVEGVKIKAKHGPNKGKTIILPKVGGALLYTLRTITRHKPDKGILPSDSVISSAAVAAIKEFVDSFE